MKDKRNNMIIDLILLIILLISFVYFMAELYLGSLLSFRIILVITLLFLLLFVLLFLSISKNNKKSLLHRLFTILLSMLLIGLSVYQMSIRTALYSVDSVPKTVYHLSLYVTDENVNKPEDIEYGEIGLLADEARNNSYAISELEKAKLSYTYSEYIDYNELIIDLMNGKIDGILVSDAIYQKMCDRMSDVAANTHAIKDFNHTVKIVFDKREKDLINEPFTIFVSGMDQNGDVSLAAKSDVNMILMVDPNKHHVEIISLLRDTYVPNPAYDYYPDKLTHTSYDGIDNTIESIESVFGFDIDIYVRVNFSTLIRIVDALGGIDVDVALSFCEQDSNRSYENLICLEEGNQHLSGEEALAYARHRDSYSDIERTKAQQQLVEALADRILSPEGISKISDVLKIAGEAIGTNIDMNSVKKFMRNEIDNPKAWSFSSTSLSKGIFATLPCISWDSSWPLSVYLLSYKDLSTVYEKYLDMFDVMDFSFFGFNLNQELNEEFLPPYDPYLITAENVDYKLNEVFALQPADPIEIYVAEPDVIENNDEDVFDPMADIKTSKSISTHEKE